MIQNGLEGTVLRKYDEYDRILPDYRGYGINAIPNSILKIFDTEPVGPELDDKLVTGIDLQKFSRVILFYIDGLKYDSVLESSVNGGFFKKVAERGIVSPITTVFPSTTASANATLNTGLEPIDHTLLEWEMYYHETGALIYTLPFRPVTWKYEKQARKLDPRSLFEGGTIHSMLRDRGVDSYVFVNRAITKGVFSKQIFEGSSMISHSYLTDCVVNLRKLLESTQSPLYSYVYLESADSIGHEYGPETDAYMAEVNNISRVMEKELIDKIDPIAAKETLIIFTSDHGQVPVKPESTVYLNDLDDIENSFELHMNGRIPPVGSPRDLFLHIEPERLEETQTVLEERLYDRADVLTISDAIGQGLFGKGQASQKFLMRSGNLMILPRWNETVWYKMKGVTELSLLGLHGGLNRNEMLVPLGIADLGELIQR